jgi:hypothetical protein
MKTQRRYGKAEQCKQRKEERKIGIRNERQIEEKKYMERKM